MTQIHCLGDHKLVGKWLLIHKNEKLPQYLLAFFVVWILLSYRVFDNFLGAYGSRDTKLYFSLLQLSVLATNKAGYVSGKCNYIILHMMEENKEHYIPYLLNNEGSELWIEGYEGWDLGRPFLSYLMSPKIMSRLSRLGIF